MRYEDVVLADGPVGYWPLTELTGTTATDRGSTGVNGTWNNTPVLGAVPFPAGGRAPYIGASPYVSISDNAAWSSGAGASGVLTLEAWARPAVVHANVAFFIAKGTGAAYEWGLYSLPSGGFQFSTYAANGAAETDRLTGVAAVGRWYHVVGTYDKAASLQVLYLNGRLADTGTVTTTMTDGASPVEIGRRSDGGGVLFNGHVAHAAIYNKVLTANRIGVHYRAGIRQRSSP